MTLEQKQREMRRKNALRILEARRELKLRKGKAPDEDVAKAARRNGVKAPWWNETVVTRTEFERIQEVRG